ncbi:type IV pilus biogenesis protein PilM [Thermodesulfovibrio hydrogeniphilus]
MIIGIDIEPSSIKVAQIKKKFELVQWEIFDLPMGIVSSEGILDKDGLVKNLAKINTKLNLRNPKVAFSISGPTYIAVRIVKVPYTDKDEIALNLPYELDKYIPFSVKEVYHDFHIIEKSNDTNSTEILLAVANKDIVNEYIGVFEKAGMNVAVVDIGAIALYNVYEINYTDNYAALIVNIGEKVINFVVAKKKKPLYIKDSIHSFNPNVNELTEDEIRNFADEISAEIYRQIEYFKNYMSEESINKIYLTGIPVISPVFISAVSDRLEQEVMIFNPFRQIKIDKKIPSRIQNYSHLASISIGLSLRGTEKLK